MTNHRHIDVNANLAKSAQPMTENSPALKRVGQN